MKIVAVVIMALLVVSVSSRPFKNKKRRSVTAPGQYPPPECYLKYFLNQSPPQGSLVDQPSSERFICQSIPSSPDEDYFATLFDDEAGIAIFSAYTVNFAQAQDMDLYRRREVSNYWRHYKELSRQGSTEMYYGRGKGTQGFDKGHLNPAHINSFDKDHIRATFTYSNAVPQYGHFNRGPWNRCETKIMDYVKLQCAEQRGESAVMYLLTGTSKFRLQVGADKTTQEKETPKVEYFPSADAEDRIVRPNSMWTAGCCVWNDESGTERAQSIAVMGNNDFTDEGISISPMNLAELEKLLVDENSEPVNLFPSVKECRKNSYLL